MMTPARWLTISVLASAWVLHPTAAVADPILGQVDTFEDGTAQGWFTGGGPVLGTATPAATMPDGGPAGAGDAFMLLTAVGGAGPLSRLNVMNASQWAGDYLASGVTSIEMDLNNFGQTDLFLRLGLSDPIPGPPTNAAFTTDPVVVRAGGGWTRAVFRIGPGFLTAALGSVDQALSGATLLNLYHSPAPLFPNPAFPIPAVTAQLGVDNILAVPEPSSIIPAAVGLLMLAGWGRGSLRVGLRDRFRASRAKPGRRG